MVRLHMLHDDIVELPPVQCVCEILEELPRHSLVDRIHEDGFVVIYQV